MVNLINGSPIPSSEVVIPRPTHYETMSEDPPPNDFLEEGFTFPIDGLEALNLEPNSDMHAQGFDSFFPQEETPIVHENPIEETVEELDELVEEPDEDPETGPTPNQDDDDNDNDPLFMIQTDYESEDIGNISELEMENENENEEGNTGQVRYPVFEPGPNAIPEFTVGQMFYSMEDAKNAIGEYGVRGGYKLKFEKMDTKRVRAKCKGNTTCKWHVLISEIGKTGNFQLKTMNPKHDCPSTLHNPLATRIWLAKKLLPELIKRPKMTTADIIKEVKEEWNLEINIDKAYKIRCIAFDMIHGKYKEQYARIRDYAAEILKGNPGASVFVRNDPDKDPINDPTGVIQNPTFQRMYVCFPVCKEGFKFCRPLICVDGAFLKGHNTNQLLTVVGRDANDQIFPIAIAVVEMENKDTWRWFLELVLEDLGGMLAKNYVWMSDQQKGLESLFNELDVEHRFCVRHLYSNFRKHFPSEELKKLMWYAAKCPYEGGWEELMGKIREKSHAAYEHLMGIDKKFWCIHAFSPLAQCDTVVNNLCESFNSILLPAREMPIVHMWEWIIQYLMRRFRTQYSSMSNYTAPICPRVMKRLQKFKELSRVWTGHRSGREGSRFLVIGMGTQFNVDLSRRQCTCGLWQKIGIPCPHAVQCIIKKDKDLIDYVDNCYKRTTFLKQYSGSVLGTNGKDQWPKLNTPPLNAPPFVRRPGRPRKLRKKQPEENNNGTASSRKFQTCGKCSQPGHNRRSCKGWAPSAMPTQPMPPQPRPSQPMPSRLRPTQLRPTQPRPTQPRPSQPIPSQPRPSQPMPSQPKPSQPMPTQPMSSQPRHSQPMHSLSRPTQLRPSQLMPSQPRPIVNQSREVIIQPLTSQQKRKSESIQTSQPKKYTWRP